MAAADNTPKSPDRSTALLNAYAEDVAALEFTLGELAALVALTRRALDVALAEAAAHAADRDAWREAHSVTLAQLHEAQRTSERLTAQLQKQRQAAPR